MVLPTQPQRVPDLQSCPCFVKSASKTMPLALVLCQGGSGGWFHLLPLQQNVLFQWFLFFLFFVLKHHLLDHDMSSLCEVRSPCVIGASAPGFNSGNPAEEIEDMFLAQYQQPLSCNLIHKFVGTLFGARHGFCCLTSSKRVDLISISSFISFPFCPSHIL